MFQNASGKHSYATDAVVKGKAGVKYAGVSLQEVEIHHKEPKQNTTITFVKLIIGSFGFIVTVV